MGITRLRKRGRPALPESERKSHIVRVRLDADTYRLIERAAGPAGVSAWVRGVVQARLRADRATTGL